MSFIVVAYSTLSELPPLEFPHTENSRQPREGKDLAEHLRGFVGYVASRGDRKMTPARYAVLQHIMKVRCTVSFNIEEGIDHALAEWAVRANAILFTPDGCVRDPYGNVLVDAETGQAEEGASIPYTEDARQRRSRTLARISPLGLNVPAHVPPVISELEVRLRPSSEVGQRALALFVVAVRGESLAQNDPLDVPDLRKRYPEAFEALSPNERSFMMNGKPEQQAIVNAAWRYEALSVLEWSLGMFEPLPAATAICDVPATVQRIVEEAGELASRATLRPVTEILDALDEHFCLHWCIRQARLGGEGVPADLDPGVVHERHYALNWLVRHQGAAWDDVDTPT